MALIQQNEHTGMKMTEVGWIPKDWECKSFGKVLKIGHGKDYKHLQFGPIPVYGTGGYMTSVNDYLYDGESACIGRKGTINRPIFLDGRFWTVDTLFYTHSFKDTFPKFVFYAFQQIDWLSYNEATGVPRLTAQKIEEIECAFPPTSEQRRIAQVLSDTDSLIASLSRTIEKKRLVKQGAMQQLLTGKTRLKGFSGEWVEKVIGNIGKTYNGITGKTKADFGCGNARYITFLNVLNNPIIDINILERVNINFDEEQNEVRRGDLFFNTSSETPEEVGICATLKQNVEEVYLNSFCFGFRISDEDVDNQYLAYYFRSEQGRALMTMLAQGATRYNLSKDNFNKSCIVLPPTRDEQQAIANILTTMDNEIASLEAELQKYKALKQGMMQKLLTGQIRLK